MMKSGLILSAFILLSLSPGSDAADLKTTDKGIFSDAGSLGDFTLGYPTLSGSA